MNSIAVKLSAAVFVMVLAIASYGDHQPEKSSEYQPKAEIGYLLSAACIPVYDYNAALLYMEDKNRNAKQIDDLEIRSVAMSIIMIKIRDHMKSQDIEVPIDAADLYQMFSTSIAKREYPEKTLNEFKQVCDLNVDAAIQNKFIPNRKRLKKYRDEIMSGVIERYEALRRIIILEQGWKSA